MDESGASRRRRGAGHVTQTACTECRKKRAKCDGQNPCGRCSSQPGIDCVYEPHVRQSKDNMRSEIEELRTAQRQNEQILAAIISGDNSAAILEQLRGGETIESITNQLDKIEGGGATQNTTFRRPSDQNAISGALRLARSIENSPLSTLAFSDSQGSGAVPTRQFDISSHQPWGSRAHSSDYESSAQDIGESRIRWGSDPQTGRSYPLIGRQDPGLRRSPIVDSEGTRGQGQEIILGFKDQPFNPSHWTTVTSNEAFVDHIMALYFCWEYPTFASLNKEHFLEDYRTGTQRYCSSLLVNTILALGCRFSNHPEARSNPTDGNTAGDHFYAEALRLADLEEDRHVLTTIQALGLMSLREASCGRSSESLFLSGQSIRLAIEIGLHQDSPDDSSTEAEIDHEVRSATFWGAFSLDQAWALSTGRLPQFSRDIRLANKPAIIHHVEASAWVPYTDDGAPMERPCTQPSNVRSVFRSFCELSEIIHKSLYFCYSPGIDVTSKALLAVYREYLQWYDGLTPVLRLGENFTPAVLFAHMHYHFAILLLFRPFMKLDILGSSVSPRDVCAQASDAISALVKSYKQLYSLRRTPSFVPYFVLTSSIAHMVIMSSSRCGPEKLRQGLTDLKEMTQCHAIAIRALDILKYLVAHWEVEGLSDEEGEELRDVKSICRPRSRSLNQFCPHAEGPDVANKLKRAENDNPLFWPFPLQGKPLLDTERLEHCGFALSKEWMADLKVTGEDMDLSLRVQRKVMSEGMMDGKNETRKLQYP